MHGRYCHSVRTLNNNAVAAVAAEAPPAPSVVDYNDDGPLLLKKIRRLISEPIFVIGGSRLWDKDPKICGKKRKRSSIQS